tara:strand:+ start:932 stop:1111 length:180 start_codon:yes stop_codon:yes gene_type:complete
MGNYGTFIIFSSHFNISYLPLGHTETNQTSNGFKRHLNYPSIVSDLLIQDIITQNKPKG